MTASNLSNISSVCSPLYWVAIVFIALGTCAIILRVRKSLGYAEPSEVGRFACLDGLRGILAISVFAHHAAIQYVFQRTGVWTEASNSFYTFLGGGAVALFFMLTGFLFGYKALRKPDSVKPLPLLENRIRRLMPLYLATYAVILMMVAVGTHFKLRTSIADVIWSALVYSFGGFFNLGKVNGYELGAFNASVTWSLFYEWRFYLFVPLFPALIRKPWQLLCVIISFLALSCFPQPWTEHVAYFFAGLAAAHLAVYVQGGSKSDNLLRCKGYRVVSLALLAVCAFNYNDCNWLMRTLLLAPVFWATVFDFSVIGLLTAPATIWLGTISYGVYLGHGIILALATWCINHFMPISMMSTELFWTLMMPLSAVITLVFTFTYDFIEKPFITKSTPQPKISEGESLKLTKVFDTTKSHSHDDLIVSSAK